MNEPDILSRVCADLGPQRVLSTVIAYLAAKPSQLETVPLICICQLYLVGICLQNSLSIETLVHSTTIAKGTVLELQDQVCLSKNRLVYRLFADIQNHEGLCEEGGHEVG